MNRPQLSRRRFLARASTAALLGAPAASAAGARGASGRLSIGLIGCGDRGSQLLGDIRAVAAAEDAEVTAVCDVWKVNLERAAARLKDWNGREPRRLTRFGDLLALADVDAVVIATPDFSHAPILVEALKAGKDAYVEKPFAIDLARANEAFDLARSLGRVVQCGTQYRSHGGYAAASKALAAGVLGRISRVSASASFNEPRWARPAGDCRKEDVDWGAFLLDRPVRPFDPLLLRRWQLYREFTNGLPGLWMSHYADAVHMLTGAAHPASAVALGGVYVWKDGREHCDTFHALLEYPEGFLFDWGMGLANSAGNHFTVHGSKGTLLVSRAYMEPDALEVSGEGGREGERAEARRIEPEPASSHMGDWFGAIRSRRRPRADIEHGHRHAVATILAAKALETGVRQRYDPAKRAVGPG